MSKTIAEKVRDDNCFNVTSARNQREFLLARLKQAPVTTLEARQWGIMAPAPRIFELKKQGHNIITRKAKETTVNCVTRIAEYVLLPSENEQEGK